MQEYKTASKQDVVLLTLEELKALPPDTPVVSATDEIMLARHALKMDYKVHEGHVGFSLISAGYKHISYETMWVTLTVNLLIAGEMEVLADMIKILGEAQEEALGGALGGAKDRGDRGDRGDRA
jgi:hypothetical protein